MKGRNNIGTNFYWFKEKQGKDFEHHEGLHIGKRSCGWVFHFQAHHKPFLHSYKDYKEVMGTDYVQRFYPVALDLLKKLKKQNIEEFDKLNKEKFICEKKISFRV